MTIFIDVFQPSSQNKSKVRMEKVPFLYRFKHDWIYSNIHNTNLHDLKSVVGTVQSVIFGFY